jgi:hypothetical protein
MLTVALSAVTSRLRAREPERFSVFVLTYRKGNQSLALTRPKGESYVDLSQAVPYNFKTIL